MAEEKSRLPDDVVEYLLFPSLPDTIDDEEIERHLEQQLNEYLGHLSPWLVDYIWQNQPFNLSIVSGLSSTPGHLKGVTCYGDNVEDEWFIVYLLMQLSKKHQDLIIQINDSDGEFLLIEAANHIPKWLNPDTSENRIFLHQGKLHIVPTPQKPSDPFPLWTPSIEEATKCINDFPQRTVASEKVQECISCRISGFPKKIYESAHYAHCYIPASVGAILQHKPAFVAPAVQAFLSRDSNDLKSCRTFTHFRPGTRVMRRVKFTRCLYAQLLKQKFTPDPRSGFTTPAPSKPKFKAYDLGSKLSHGFEILCSRCQGQGDSTNGNSSFNDSRWQRYLKSLHKNGYFKGEMEGSRVYKQLYNKARNYFDEMVQSQLGNEYNPGLELISLSKSLEYDVEKMRKEEKDLLPEDSDKWLDITPQELDNMLAKAAGRESVMESSADDMVNTMRAFVEKVSSHEGAEFPESRDRDEGDMNFESGGFIKSMHKMFEFEDDGNSSSDMGSEYGSEESEDELSCLGNPKKRVPVPKSQFSEYMDSMDRELANTNIGKSFTKTQDKPVAPVAPPRKKKQPRPVSEYDIDDLDDDDFKPVNVDMNLVSNMLESYDSQGGAPGPVSNIMGASGAKMPTSRPKGGK